MSDDEQGRRRRFVDEDDEADIYNEDDYEVQPEEDEDNDNNGYNDDDDDSNSNNNTGVDGGTDRLEDGKLENGSKQKTPMVLRTINNIDNNDFNNTSNTGFELVDGSSAVLSKGSGEQEQTANKDRITTKYLTKYEKARILGTRALHLSMSAPPMVELEGETDPLEIAMKELKQQKIPLIIRRFLPDNSFEDWSLDELIID